MTQTRAGQATPEDWAALERLRSLVSGLGSLLVAVSGGLDSRFLAQVAWGVNPRVVAVHATGPHVPAWESAAAVAWLHSQAIPHHGLAVDPLELPPVLQGAPERCYACKRALFTTIVRLAHDLGLATVAEGSQADDAGSHRPGRRALAELGVRSPLAEVGLGKAAIRRLAQELGVAAPDQPSRPCLLTRWPYGQSPRRELLPRLAAVEQALASLGLRDFRLRLPAPGRAMLQVAAGEAPFLREQESVVARVLSDHGFGNAEVVSTETVSGYYDR